MHAVDQLGVFARPVDEQSSDSDRDANVSRVATAGLRTMERLLRVHEQPARALVWISLTGAEDISTVVSF